MMTFWISTKLMSKMKKNLILFGVTLAAIFTLNSCTKEMQAPVEETTLPYTIYANLAETKTVNAGLATKWASNDMLSVFHAPTGTMAYSANCQFVIKDVESGEFNVSSLNGSLAEYNDWYVQYPYNSGDILTSTYLSIGYATSQTQQRQWGNDNMDHIDGYYYPLHGVAKNVSSDNYPTVNMKHLTSLVKVEVTNNTQDELVVSTISLTADEELSGYFKIDFSQTEPVFTPVSGRATKTAVLGVAEAESISNKASANFYLAVKPFTAREGQTLTLSVNGVDKNLVMTKDVEFASGRIKTLKFSYESGDVQTPSTIREILDEGAGKYANTEGVVVATYRHGFIIEDATARILVYEAQTPTASIGDRVSIIGTTSVFDTFLQIQSPTITVLEKAQDVTYPNVSDLTAEELEALYQTSEISYVELTGQLKIYNANYARVILEGTSVNAALAYTPDSFGLDALNNNIVKVKGYTIGRRTLTNPCVTIMLTEIAYVSEGVVEATAEEIRAAEEGKVYKMTGYIPDIKNGLYGNYDLVDYSGSVLVYGTLNENGETKKFEQLGINAGDIVTVQGPKIIQNGSVALEDVTVVRHIPVHEVDIWEFLYMYEDNPDVYFRLSGKVRDIVMDRTDPTKVNPYGNFYLEQNGEIVYVYGLLRGWGGPARQFESMNIKEGDKISIIGVRDTYANTIEVASAFLVAHEPAPVMGTEDFTHDDNIVEW